MIPAVAAFVMLMLAAVVGQSRSPAGKQDSSSIDVEIQQAATAIEQANDYDAILTAAESYADVLSSPRVVELVDELLKNPALNETQRGVLLIERQLSLDCRQFGAVVAARLLAIRVIAGNAISSRTPQQFAAVLEKFSPLVGAMTVPLVRQALDTPGNTWPKPLLPLMEQLARDWPKVGALGAATRMAEAANKPPAPSPAPTPVPTGGPTLVGHWRSTTIAFETPRDEHLVLHKNGDAETWIERLPRAGAGA
jgi:hypothetical protein